MAQHEDAAGDAITSDDALDMESLVAEHLAGEEDEEEEPVEDEAEEESEAEDEAEDDAEEAEAEEEDLPPIEPPVSWTAEEKEAFKALPREMQETVTRRESERERFVQSMAQEATRARQEAEREAIAQVAEIERNAAEQLRQLAASLLPQKPDPRLLQGGENERAYFYQQQAIYEEAAAQQQQLQQAASQRDQRLSAYQQELEKREMAEFRQTLAEQLPEYLDPTQGPKLQQELGSIALELGYSPEQIAEARASDIIAMKKASDWKADAEKYRTLMSKKMETVRAHKGKALRPVSKPGAAQPGTQAQRQRGRAVERLAGGTDRDLEAYLRDIL